MSHFGNVVVVEDSNSQAMLYKAYLSDANYQVNVFELALPALDFIQANPSLPSVILLDLELPDMHGLDFLKKMNEQAYGIPVIVATGQGSMSVAVDAMRLGAIDFIEKPVQFERLLVSVNNAIETNKLRNVVQQLNDELGHAGYSDFIGSSLPMKVTYRIIESASKSKASVFITGESGTGKELCARAIHNRSDRADKPFIAVNCAAIPADIFESEMFGHVKGAFTGASENRMGAAEQANGGTLFLDEIGDMPADLQTRLLRILAEGEFYRVGGHVPIKVDVRVIAATHQNLEELVKEGRFREDLLHRLNVIRVHVPSLRDRKVDITELSKHFLNSAAKELGEEKKKLLPETENYLTTLPWPGNVRQLENFCRWVTVMASGVEIHIDDLPPELKKDIVIDDKSDSWESTFRKWVESSLSNSDIELLKKAVPLFETILIEEALKKTNGRRQDAAKLLGWGRNTLTRKIKELNVNL